MDFIKDIDHDEMRDGFLVTSRRKKLWNVELGIYNELRRICEKYNINFFASFGTLLGAVRHGGFVPWDDDMDFMMLRPDYERFKEVARQEINYPYFLDIWYENEDVESRTIDATVGAFTRIHDERTLAVYSWLHKPDNSHQGIMIDITPLDPIPDLREYSYENVFKDVYMKQWQIIVELSQSCLERDKVLKLFSDPNFKTLIPADTLKRFALLPLKKKGEILDRYCLKFFRDSERFSFALSSITIPAKFFHDVTYLPFESTKVPAPIDYKNMLDFLYGDWHEFKITHSHMKIFSPDISYKDFFNLRNEKLN